MYWWFLTNIKFKSFLSVDLLTNYSRARDDGYNDKHTRKLLTYEILWTLYGEWTLLLNLVHR